MNATTGTLNVSGAYSQSGSGVLQADINTGDTQQSSIVNVTGSPGTPGSPGSVNLSGGTLLIDAQSSLALNTPYTVMTFAANDLYGQFAQVQTEGTLGGHTGNGNSVNLGNGDTLEVLYNEASGDIQVEVVATPASTTYTWDVGSGTWNASSGSDWNPPGNGTTPSATSNVTIGTGGGGTVTLAQDQTIASLSITNGYTLCGSKNSISTTGNVSVASGATLSIDDMNVGGTFTDSGNATFAGVLTINGAGQFLLSNGSLTGGINGSGTFEICLGYDRHARQRHHLPRHDLHDDQRRDHQHFFGRRHRQQRDLRHRRHVGQRDRESRGQRHAVRWRRGHPEDQERNGVPARQRRHADQYQRHDRGRGRIRRQRRARDRQQGDDRRQRVGSEPQRRSRRRRRHQHGNARSDRRRDAQPLSAVTNTGGDITAGGTNSDVNVQSTTVTGGTLNTASGGLLQTVGTSTLNGVTISSGSTYTTGDGATTNLNTSLTNDGTFLIDGSAGNAIANLGNNVTLSGGGVVIMKSGSGAAFLRGSGVTLTNTNDTIQGAGNIGDNAALTITNQATIDANASGQNLNLNQGGGVITNTGTLEATNGGTLNIFSKVTNTGGAITASGGTVNIHATITGGTLNATGANVMETSSFADLVGVTLSTGSTYTTGDGATTQLDTSMTNDGTFLIDGSAGNAIVNLGSNVTLSGGGVVTMKSNSRRRVPARRRLHAD